MPLGGLGVYSTVFEDESNRLLEIPPSIFLRSSLAVGAWDFGTECYVPVAIFLNDGSEFTLHLHLPQSAFNRIPYGKSPHVTRATLNDSSTNHSPRYFCSTSEVTSM